ncbi:MAG: acpP [Firmicutes bacterium]|nr:acpP [Bacillota bacterium]
MTQDRHETVYDKVVSTIADVAGVSIHELHDSTDLIDDLSLDSLAMYEIVIDLEETFQLQISDSDIDRIRTVDDAVQFILAAQTEKNSGGGS